MQAGKAQLGMESIGLDFSISDLIEDYDLESIEMNVIQIY